MISAIAVLFILPSVSDLFSQNSPHKRGPHARKNCCNLNTLEIYAFWYEGLRIILSFYDLTKRLCDEVSMKTYYPHLEIILANHIFVSCIIMVVASDRVF